MFSYFSFSVFGAQMNLTKDPRKNCHHFDQVEFMACSFLPMSELEQPTTSSWTLWIFSPCSLQLTWFVFCAGKNEWHLTYKLIYIAVLISVLYSNSVSFFPASEKSSSMLQLTAWRMGYQSLLQRCKVKSLEKGPLLGCSNVLKNVVLEPNNIGCI